MVNNYHGAHIKATVHRYVYIDWFQAPIHHYLTSFNTVPINLRALILATVSVTLWAYKEIW